MNVLIVEDDPAQLNGIASILNENYENINCLKAANYDQAVHLIQDENVQLFLLDISFGIENDGSPDGIALGSYIRSFPCYAKAPILYLTACSLDAPRAIHETNCYDFLVKPYKKEDLLYSIQKLIDNQYLEASPIELRDINGIYFRILPSKIYYIEASGKNLTVYTENDVISTIGIRLKDLCAKLPPNFIQSHRGFVVNSDYITSYDPTHSTLFLGDVNIPTPVGRKYKDFVKKIISRK